MYSCVVCVYHILKREENLGGKNFKLKSNFLYIFSFIDFNKIISL